MARRGGVTVISGWHYQTEGTMYSDVWVERGWVESVTLGMHGEQTRTRTKTGRPHQIRYITPLGPVRVPPKKNQTSNTAAGARILTHGVLEGLGLHQQVDAFGVRKADDVENRKRQT